MEHEAGQVTVSDIETRLTATREEIDATERALATLPEKKEALLGAAHFDDAALAKLETTEATLSRKKEYLAKRLPLLEKQREEVAAGHAQERITELAVESATARTQYDERLAAFQQATAQLQQAAEQLVDAYLALSNCHDEQQYYLTRFSAFSLQPTPLTELGGWPDFQRIAREIVQATARRDLHATAPQTEWGRRTYELIEDRERARQKQGLEEYRAEYRARRNVA